MFPGFSPSLARPANNPLPARWGTEMSDTKSLLNRISAFRERLERTPTLQEASPIPGALHLAGRAGPAPAWQSQNLRQLAGHSSQPGPMPKELTSRARRVLEIARDLVLQQREISDDVFYRRMVAQSGLALDPLVRFHQATVSATEAALRLIQAMPDSAEFQIRLCDGLETVLDSIRTRLNVGRQTLDKRRTEWGRVERLARYLGDVQSRRLISFDVFTDLAEEILVEARRGVPLRFPSFPEETVARQIAAHSLTVAAVVARIVPHDYEWASQPVVPVALALLMDIGMIGIPAGIVNKAEQLTVEERRRIEIHPKVGAALLLETFPDLGPLADVIAAHHERLDGTGYPNGLSCDQIPALAKMLAAADHYAGMAADRPHRPAHDIRTALTDTLLAAEEGKLDRDFAEYLLHLSFYPVGSVVELTDGRIAVVVGSHPSRVNLRATTRPVVAILCGVSGELLPKPEVVDLAGSEFGGILRSLSTDERTRKLSLVHPDLC